MTGASVCLLAVAGIVADAQSITSSSSSSAYPAKAAPSGIAGSTGGAERALASLALTQAASNRRGVIQSSVAAGEGYEITIRFRDGKMMVFNEATPRAWRPGDRVIVIDSALAANN
jgi:outer membrane lipoprotein SlyB